MRNERGEIILLCGISGSGKTTWAHNTWLRRPYNTVMVSRDKMRELMFGYDEETIQDYYKRDDVGKLERQISRAVDVAIHEGVELGKTVIVDVTNLNVSYILPTQIHNVRTTLVTFHTPLHTCIERVSGRNRKVSAEVIGKQYQQFKSLIPKLTEMWGEPEILDEEGRAFYDISDVKTLVNNPLNPPVVIYDLDGCLAKKGDRDIFDTSKCDLDTLIEPVFNSIPKDVPVIICTGRDDKYREVTEKWLEDNGIQYSEIHFRKYGDSRPDWRVKTEMWEDITKRWYIDRMYDDRDQVIWASRSLGFTVFQVAYGKF